jgi:xanthine dehydrogenase YagR molybdenum-binding subunit
MAAERPGVELSMVTVEVGDSRLPPAPVAGGLEQTASACNAVMKVCDAIRDKIFHAAATANDGPLAGQLVNLH